MTAGDRGTHRRRKGRYSTAAVGLAVASVLAACGGGSSGRSASTGASTASSTAASTTVATARFAPASTAGLSTAPPPWPLPADAGPDIAAAGLSTSPSESLVVHYHAHLDVIVNGQPVEVPAGIGFLIKNGQAVAVSSLHTHDTSGVVHIESPADRQYTLGQLFTEWGVLIGPGRLGGLTDGGGNALRVFVNGTAFTGDPAQVVFKAHQEVAVWYGPAGETPRVPANYSFPSGE